MKSEHILRSEIRQAVGPDPAIPEQMVHSLGDLLQRRFLIRPVNKQKVDIVHVQPSEGGLAACKDLLRAHILAQAPGAQSPIIVQTAFGYYPHPVADALQGLAHQLFRVPEAKILQPGISEAVHRSRIDEGYPTLNHPPDSFHSSLRVHVAPVGTSQLPGSCADDGHIPAHISKRLVPHCNASSNI